MEHFYHFFQRSGADCQLLLTGGHRDLYFMRSDGPMNRLLLELNLKNLILVEKTMLPRLVEIEKTRLEGFDAYHYYDWTAFLRSQEFFLHILS